MALESTGLQTQIDMAFKLCHDIIKNNMDSSTFDPEKINTDFRVGQQGIWAVFASILDGRPAVEIRICVG